MVKINVFLESANRLRRDRRAGLLAFYQALDQAGEDVDLVTAAQYAACDIAVIYGCPKDGNKAKRTRRHIRSEEHTSELQSLMRNSYAVFCLTKKRIHNPHNTTP